MLARRAAFKASTKRDQGQPQPPSHRPTKPKIRFVPTVEECEAMHRLDYLIDVLGNVQILQEHLTSNYDCAKKLGATMADLLMKRKEASTKEVLLLAVREENVKLAEIMLLFIGDKGWKQDKGCTGSHTFQPHVTPLHLACFVNNFRLVRLFLSHDHKILIPHKATCVCKSCQTNRREGESLQSCHERIDSYKAISSNAYSLYHGMVKQIKQLSGDIARLCWTEDEVLTLIDNDDGCPIALTWMKKHPRIDLALDNELTDLITSTPVQEVMTNQWMGSWATQSSNNTKDTWKWTNYLLQICFPIPSVIYIVTGGRFPKSNKNPFGRFLSYSASYIFFMVNLAISMMVRQQNFRGFPEERWERYNLFYTWLYIIGMLFWDCSTFIQIGISKFFSVWWHTFDFVNACLFLFAGNFLIRAHLDANIDGMKGLFRVRWDPFDPQLVYETLYYSSCIIAMWRVFYLLQMTRMIGPTVISIKACVQNTCYYLIVMIIAIVSFSFGVNAMYSQYFGPENYIEEEAGSYTEIITTDRMLNGFFKTMYTLYEAFYGYIPPQMQGMIVGTMGPPFDQKINVHHLTEWFCMVVIGVYHSLIIIALLNLMISLLVNFASEIMANSDTEWKFVRCHIWQEYFDDCHAVPPPLNIPWLFIKAAQILLHKQRRFKWPDFFYVEERKDEQYREKYRSLMITLYKRYLTLVSG